MNRTGRILLFLKPLRCLFYLVAALQFSCANSPEIAQETPLETNKTLKCLNPERYANRVVGDGHCVSLIRACSGAPFTSQWRPGEQIMSLSNQSVAKGSIIATFKNGRYPNQHGWHAAVYIDHGPEGIWVWDQWSGKPVHRRLIRVRHDNADAGNTAQAYRIVKIH